MITASVKYQWREIEWTKAYRNIDLQSKLK